MPPGAGRQTALAIRPIRYNPRPTTPQGGDRIHRTRRYRPVSEYLDALGQRGQVRDELCRPGATATPVSERPVLDARSYRDRRRNAWRRGRVQYHRTPHDRLGLELLPPRRGRAPFLGVVAVEPAGDEPVSAILSGAYGGNLVLRDLTAGQSDRVGLQRDSGQGRARRHPQERVPSRGPGPDRCLAQATRNDAMTLSGPSRLGRLHLAIDRSEPGQIPPGSASETTVLN